jgi:hypothetical protein
MRAWLLEIALAIVALGRIERLQRLTTMLAANVEHALVDLAVAHGFFFSIVMIGSARSSMP